MPQALPDPRARRRSENTRWCFAVSTLVWFMLAAQAPPIPQPPETMQNPRMPDLPALPHDLDNRGERPILPIIPLSSPRPQTGSSSVSSFVAGLKGNDAVLEIALGQGRILSTRTDLSGPGGKAVIAVGDPSVMDFVVLSPRQMRLVGHRLGTTDLSITTNDGQILNFEVHVIADLSILEMRLKALFPDASVTLSQASGDIVVQGQARSPGQVAHIIQIVTTHVAAITTPIPGGGGSGGSFLNAANPNQGDQSQAPPVPPANPIGIVTPELNPANRPLNMIFGAPRIVNLLRIPTSQQVLLKVRIAELNRTSLRQIGANFLGVDPRNGAIVGTQIGVPATALGQVGNSVTTPTSIGRQLYGGAETGSTTATTLFGIFQDNHFEFMLSALRQNGLVKILAEPNLVALSGQRASFLAGGEYPVPIPQVSGSGVAPTITVTFKQFGVLLSFLPTIIDDDVIRLAVAPEVSEIDTAVSVTLVAGGSAVPGLSTRKAETTVELHPGQTLAMAGLLQLELDGTTTRIPYLGDLPIIGPFFSNSTAARIEKELVVLVTPYLVEPMHKGQVPSTPGDEVKEPGDLEFYLLNRIEGRTGRDVRSTTSWDDPFHVSHVLDLERNYVAGPSGFSQ